MTITGALAYGELAAMMPNAGGQYVYLRESLGSLWGFLYGWTLFLVIQTGTIAAVGRGLRQVFSATFFPSVSFHQLDRSTSAKFRLFRSDQWCLATWTSASTRRNLAGIIVVIVLLTVVNVFGVKTGAMVQNIFTIAKNIRVYLGLSF